MTDDFGTHDDVPPGVYGHFKGHTYQVIGVGRHSETGEPFVVYWSFEHDRLCVREKGMFKELVIRDGYSGPRFNFEEPRPHIRELIQAKPQLTDREKMILNALVGVWQEEGARLPGHCSYLEALKVFDKLGLDKPQFLIDQLADWQRRADAKREE